MSWLTKALGLQQTTTARLSDGADTLEKGAEIVTEGVENIGTATEFLGNVAQKLNGTDVDSLGKAIEMALPWAEGAAEVLGEALPPVKAAMKVLGFLTKETDPRAL